MFQKTRSGLFSGLVFLALAQPCVVAADGMQQAHSAPSSQDRSQVDLCMMAGMCSNVVGGYWLYYPIPEETTKLTFTTGRDPTGSAYYTIAGTRNGDGVSIVGSVDWSDPQRPVFDPPLPEYLTGEQAPAYGVVGAFLPGIRAALTVPISDGARVDVFTLALDFAAGRETEGQATAAPMFGVGYEITAPGTGVPPSTDRSVDSNTVRLPDGRMMTFHFYDNVTGAIASDEAWERYAARFGSVADAVRKFALPRIDAEAPRSIHGRGWASDPGKDNTASQSRRPRLNRGQIGDWLSGKSSSADLLHVLAQVFDVEATISTSATVEIGVPGFGKVSVTAGVTLKGPVDEINQMAEQAAQIAATTADKTMKELGDRLDQMMEDFRLWIEKHSTSLWHYFTG